MSKINDKYASSTFDEEAAAKEREIIANIYDGFFSADASIKEAWDTLIGGVGRFNGFLEYTRNAQLPNLIEQLIKEDGCKKINPVWDEVTPDQVDRALALNPLKFHGDN